MPDVIVMIATYRRPKGLGRLLRALENLETKAKVCVLVADNDAELREGSEVCIRVGRDGYRWTLECILVAERGIAQARNALVNHALAHFDAPFFAMLDDDEWPEPAWLDAFLLVQKATGAHALHGAVVRDYEVVPGAWLARCAGIAPLRGRTGVIDMIHGTSNVLLCRTVLETLSKPYFDPEFALTGGEDKGFFSRLRLQGIRFAWADEAVVHDCVPASRTTLRWVLQRAYRVGNSDMRVFLKAGPRGRALALETAKIAGALLLSPILLAILAPVSSRRVDALCRLSRAAGKTAAVLGSRYNEYATVHGA